MPFSPPQSLSPTSSGGSPPQLENSSFGQSSSNYFHSGLFGCPPSSMMSGPMDRRYPDFAAYTAAAAAAAAAAYVPLMPYYPNMNDSALSLANLPQGAASYNNLDLHGAIAGPSEPRTGESSSSNSEDYGNFSSCGGDMGLIDVDSMDTSPPPERCDDHPLDLSLPSSRLRRYDE